MKSKNENNNELKGVGLNPNNYIQFTDHLGPICVLMDVPLIVTDEKYAKQLTNFYPGLSVKLIEWATVTPEFLIQNYDYLLQSEPWIRDRLYKLFEPLEEKYHKVIRNIQCPHGFSDKVFWLGQCAFEDITLVYGDNMLDMFKYAGVDQFLNAFVRTGNYRYSYYLKHRQFFDSVTEEKVFSRFAKKQRTILYAPTCNDQMENCSLFEAQAIFENLPNDYNLLVKIHPLLEETDGPFLYKTMGKYEKKGNIVFEQDFPLIYPLLSRSDIYIGDRSSIGYDYLAFNRPMFFLDHKKADVKKERDAFLNRCGVNILPNEYGTIYSTIESCLSHDQEKFNKIRTEIYKYTFGDPVPEQELKQAILQSYYSPRRPIGKVF